MSFTVSERALIKRVNRKLEPRAHLLRKTRDGVCTRQDLGRFYVIDCYRNFIVYTHVGIESFARELGALADDEILGDA